VISLCLVFRLNYVGQALVDDPAFCTAEYPHLEYVPRHVNLDNLDLCAIGYREQVTLRQKLALRSGIAVADVLHQLILSRFRVAQERDWASGSSDFSGRSYRDPLVWWNCVNCYRTQYQY
jgi:hypothetical protein